MKQPVPFIESGHARSSRLELTSLASQAKAGTPNCEIILPPFLRACLKNLKSAAKA